MSTSRRADGPRPETQGSKPKKAIDRRVARTRETLEQVHLKLILERGYGAVTVEDICAVANVGRSTFYAHYSGKDDLRRSGLEHLRHELLKRQHEHAAGPGADRFLAFTPALFEHASDYQELYRALVSGRGGDIALNAIKGILSDLVRTEVKTYSVGWKAPQGLIISYVVGALMSVLTWWLDGGAKLSPAEVNAVFRQLILDGLVPLTARS